MESRLDRVLLARQGSTNPVGEATKFLEVTCQVGDGDTITVEGIMDKIGRDDVIYVRNAFRIETLPNGETQPRPEPPPPVPVMKPAVEWTPPTVTKPVKRAQAAIPLVAAPVAAPRINAAPPAPVAPPAAPVVETVPGAAPKKTAPPMKTATKKKVVKKTASQKAAAAKSAQAAGRGAKQKRNSADLAATRESVVRQFPKSAAPKRSGKKRAPKKAAPKREGENKLRFKNNKAKTSRRAKVGRGPR